MRRREVITLLGGAMASWPLAVRAQQRGKKIPLVGIIDDGPIWEPFRMAFREAGYVVGTTIAFEYRSSDGDPGRLAAAAADLVRLPVDVIATYGTPPSRAAKAATSAIPIVMILVGDPVRAGLVQSLAYPGGNVTGNTILSSELSPKRLQLVKEIIPSAARVALLWNPDNVSNTVIFEQMRGAAPDLGLTFTAVEARSADDLAGAFATLARERPDAVLLTSDPLHHNHIHRIVDFLSQNRLPGMFQTRDDAVAGGLMSYGAKHPDLFRQGAFFVHKILQGTKPADIPVQTPQRFELVINLKAAKAIGVTISDQILLRADEVIE
jgi:putative tryptophan/tyrosine transport system substrate-binding protein